MAQQARAGMKTRPLITSSTLWDVYRVGKRIAGYPTKAPVARFQILQWEIPLWSLGKSLTGGGFSFLPVLSKIEGQRREKE